ncbi:MBOAT-domain-containing protein [Amylocystis lapponica]|nr:MBOAT-domain-containing protein [Amylocystis lapponica]
MLGDAAIQMPSDLRPHTSSFELDTSTQDATRKRKDITRLTVNIPSSYRPQVEAAPHPPSRWRTPEFIAYYVIFCAVVPVMVWIPVTLSSTSHPNYPLYNRRLSSGWLFGRKVDNSDNQYRAFRGNIPALILLVGAFIGIKYIYHRISRRTSFSRPKDNLHLIPFLLGFIFLMQIGLHGTSSLKIFIILSVNYILAKIFRGSLLGPLFTWMFNAAVLFANEKNEGYKFASIHSSLEFMDSIPGIYPRWHVSFNITMLRLVSFNMDYYWACKGAGPLDTGSVLTEKQRCITSHPLGAYSYKNYIAYVLYPPLYIAGPIVTFNDFIWQLSRPKNVSLRSTMGYLLRFLACFLTLEFILHFMYVVAIKDTKAWAGASAAELCMIGFWNLIVVWLKLLVPWRFFRLWALVDEIDPPENMVRCMANNYSTLGFWRSWHRSYNLWIVRYIYIPLGGTQSVAFTSVLIFSFVALWHDLSFRLLAWGWLVSLFILPELAARYVLHPDNFGDRAWYRHVCAIGAVFNILMMMSANLVGFVIGTEGISYMLHQLIGSWEGVRFLVFVCACLFVAAQIMFEYREEELRRGIVRRC